MKKDFILFFKENLRTFIEAIINLIMFLPYFFSVPTLLKTLFYPWKNLVTQDTTVGFSLNSWFTTIGFNMMSSGIGFIMRSTIILFYFILQGIFLILLPFIFLIYIFLIPILYLESLYQKTEEQQKEASRLKFIGSHLLNQENYQAVATWFEDYYQKHLHKTRWWKRTNLFSIPPLARDWAVGFTPTLDQYGQDLTSTTYQDNTLNIVDREHEIDEIERTLAKSQEANAIIVGEEGVGKHTVVVALAKKMYEGKTQSLLMYKRIIWLNMQKILNKETDQQKRQNFFEELLTEAEAAKNIIIFIDDMEQYISSDKSKIDLTVSLEKYAKSSNLQFLGITTPFFYEKFIFTNDRLSRLFAKIDVKEVTIENAEKILLNLAFSIEHRYNLILPYETIKAAIEKSDFYITAIPFPEKAIDILDSACVVAAQKATSKQINIVTPDLIDQVLSEKTHVPTTITANTKEKLINLEKLLFESIVNQQKAVLKLSSSLRRSFLLLGKRKKPLASFLFLGPTGVGKTETAKAVSKIFFGSDSYLIRFDMSNFQSKDEIPQLIGSLDTGNPGILTKSVRETPYGVLLLDEIEKANKDLLNIFLSVLDEGYFTDGFGKKVDCKNLVIIATSNAGSDLIFTNSKKLETQPSSSNLIGYLIDQKIFSPEFLNRFDAVIDYNPLDKEAAKQIAKKMLEKISADLFKLHKVKVNVSDQYLEQLIAKGYDEKFGARNLDRLLRDEIEDKIARTVFEGSTQQGQTISL